MRHRNTYVLMPIIALAALAAGHRGAGRAIRTTAGSRKLLFWQQPAEYRDLPSSRVSICRAARRSCSRRSRPWARRSRPKTWQAAKTIVERRVNGLGVTEPLVQLQGENRIIVELPGISNPEAGSRRR